MRKKNAKRSTEIWRFYRYITNVFLIYSEHSGIEFLYTFIAWNHGENFQRNQDQNTSYRAVDKEFGISRSSISVLKLQSTGSIWNLPRCNHLQNLQYWIVTDSKSSVKVKRLKDKWWMSPTYSFRCWCFLWQEVYFI